MHKGKIGLLAAALLLALGLCSGALGEITSEPMRIVPTERVNLNLESTRGVVRHAKYDATTGVYTITVDDAATDWRTALINSEGGLMMPAVFFGFTPPANAAFFVQVNGGFSPETLAIQLNEMERYEEEYQPVEPGMTVQNGEILGEFLADRNVFAIGDSMINDRTDPENTEPYMIAVRWYDADRNYLFSEQLFPELIRTRPNTTISVKSFLVPNGSLQANTTGLPGLDMKRGSQSEVIYTVKNDEQLMAAAAQRRDYSVYTGVTAPVGAVSCGLLDPGEPDENESMCAVTNGRVELALEFAFAEDEMGMRMTLMEQNDRPYVLRWKDARGNMILDQLLFLRLTTPNNKPAACYVAQWQPVPRERLALNQNALGSAAGYDYDEAWGWIQYHFDEEKLDASQLASSRIQLQVKAPAGARYCRINGGGGSNFTGEDPSLKHMIDTAMKRDYPWNQFAVDQTGLLEVKDAELYRAIPVEDLVTVYLPNVETRENFGGIYELYWYAEDSRDAEPILMEYINETGDAMGYTMEGAPVENEDEIEFVNPDAFVYVSLGDWRLVIEKYPQRGNHAVHYMLHLEDWDGNYVEPGEAMVLYMGYPEGCSYGDGNRYFIRHYHQETVDGNYDAYEDVELTTTAAGIRFTTASFSPFVLGWTAGEKPEETPVPTPAPTLAPTEDIPQTGDATPVALLAAIALLGMALLLTELRRGRKHSN